MSVNTHFIQGQIFSHHLKAPQIGDRTFIAPTASLIGDVSIGHDSSIWFSTVIRGDVEAIEIGSHTNVQDLSMCHVSYKKAALRIGSHVTIGHQCILHGCRIDDRVLVGMGTIVMDNVHIASDCLIGAGSLLTENLKVPSGMLVLGRPAKVIRPLTEKEIQMIHHSAVHYQLVAESYVNGKVLTHPTFDGS